MASTRIHPLSRREVLAGGLGGMTALGLTVSGAGWTPAVAASSLHFGDHRLTPLSDGHLTLPMNFVLPDQSPAEIDALLGAHGIPTDSLRPDCTVTLLESGERRVLFDVGAGANFQPTAGRLPETLAAHGLSPEEITDVVLTHGHPDHLWGILDDFDDLLYPQARIWIPEAEWAYWRAEDTLSKTPEARKSFVVGAQARLEVIADQVSMVRPGQEVLPGVEAMDTAGHTPGHMSYFLHSGTDSLVVIGDAISNAVISFEKPEWISGTDHDGAQGVATRQRLLDRLAADHSRILGFHLPHPGVGRAERSGGAYRFVAD